MYNEYFGFSESPFKVTPDPRFFFVNPCYEEAFATLRYGIDARKGLIVVTGEAGTGKTTLLKRLAHGLEPNVHTACIFDPHLSFTELLRCALSDLGMATSGADRFTLMERFYDYLIRHVEDHQIVTLMIDEAQSLSGELLEEVRLLSNLETDTQKLLQIVLLGQPEFEERLDQAQLLRLKQRVALRCRLRRLERYEIGPYIDARLKAVHRERRDLFDSGSVERIGLYSKGNPRIINVICDNALLIAFAASASRVSVKQIDEAAHELKLQDERQGGSPTPRSSANLRPDADENFLQPYTHALHETGIIADRWRTEFEPSSVDIGKRPIRSRRSKDSHVREAAFLLILTVTVGVAFVVAAEHGHLSFPAARNYIDKLAVFVREIEQGRAILPVQLQTPNTSNGGAKVLPTQDNPPRPTEDLRETIVPSPDTTVDGEPEHFPPAVSEKLSAKNSSEINDSKRRIAKRPLPDIDRNDERLRTRKLEFEIYKAIYDRAIRGVEVSVSDDTVYLDGRVATQQQILAAVRATLTVPGVKNIRNRIVVDG